MAATVFYLDPLPPSAGDLAILDGPEGRHAATVRRIRIGEQVVLADGRGGVAWGTAVTVGKDTLEVRVERRESIAEPVPRVVVVQALPKSDRSELAVELMTEAGADEIIPWEAARCVARWQGPKAHKNVERWQRVAASAAKQARRAHIPLVHKLATSRDVAAAIAATVAASGTAVVLHEDATEALATVVHAVGDVRSILLIVGPEGGVSPEETEQFTQAGAQPVRLGPTILRTSTAAAVTLGALGVLTARWDNTPMRY
ncbi:16S rRNA (uracil(1498)-N(3))-methyltransferase [Hoyosella altamirensis]|uniref:Ribosomal RNA small subunit methyltransferase E n=1 Tax=Hoyosella altamirensis TaxID=616997 RepID=A0A839RSX2_9ACTN|nr:16S rRNA (uracil(1498)-N(3))-methyltransferase [Hoyosella altamirensis]MBB3039013.1 16S rRNA (uracil1498-N3)-methyltransferase [Hoyosella altamirensis]